MKKWIPIALLSLAGAAAVYEYFLPPVKKAKQAEYDYALLLGCPAHDDGSMSRSQIARCNLAISAYENHLFKTLIISGGAVKNQYVEAEVMRDYILQHVEMPIVCETKARNTFENFRLAAKMIHGGSILILTSSLHARRSSAIAAQFFKHFGVLTYPDRKMKHILREIPSRYIYIKMELAKKLK